MRSSVPPHRRRPDSPFPTLQGPCDRRDSLPLSHQGRPYHNLRAIWGIQEILQVNLPAPCQAHSTCCCCQNSQQLWKDSSISLSPSSLLHHPERITCNCTGLVGGLTGEGPLAHRALSYLHCVTVSQLISSRTLPGRSGGHAHSHLRSLRLQAGMECA